MIGFRFAARSDVGRRRTTNQDSGLASRRLLAVADGLGGHAGGDVASSLVIACLTSSARAEAPADRDSIETAVREAHRRIGALAGRDELLAGMGTTLTALWCDGYRLMLAHIGDSRAYVLRDGTLQQLTTDHTLVQSLLDEGALTATEAASHPYRSVLARALDGRADADVDVSVLDVHAGDRFLLCSDGLSGVVDESTQRRTLATCTRLGSAADQLIELANQAGGPDNITCVVAEAVDMATDPGRQDDEIADMLMVGAAQAAPHAALSPPGK